ncbi:MLO-like protein 13 isoform X2 [Phalaenopsis equestris]|uniref:MLO-like protein 13 isoform X2 n=1 Tax=Phalaenopsis equestris TaxID=78828 RepID=UPI0009E1B66B|nr:MLO-like protein 13 isoform X2 [Phalaenopsis equestris]
MASIEDSETLEYTATWVVALVCTIIVVVSLLAERFLHYLGKFLKHEHQDALFRALEKLKEELMLLGFISLLLTVSQSFISDICIPRSASFHMLPCIKEEYASVEVIHYRAPSEITWKRQRLLAGDVASNHCTRQGKVQLLSLEALHQLHIFIFVLAVAHVVFSATTMVLGGARIRQWQHWEKEIHREISSTEKFSCSDSHQRFSQPHHEFVQERAAGFWRKSAVVSRMMSFFKQFYGSFTKSDYKALRAGFIMRHCPTHSKFNFHKYMMRALEDDFKKVVGISWYLWLFVIIFLLINIHGWHAYFWLSFLPLILVLTVGAKLEHIITRLAIKFAETHTDGQGRQSTYGFHSCILEGVGHVIPRLAVGVIVQVLCSYSTLPLYAIVTQMGDSYKQAIFAEHMQTTLHGWVAGVRKRKRSGSVLSSSIMRILGRKKKMKKQEEAYQGEVQMQMMMRSEDSGHLHELPASEIEACHIEPV